MYRNIAYKPSSDRKSGTIEIFTWDENGNRIHKSVPHKCFVTYEVDYPTKLKSIYGTYLKRKFFESTNSRYKWLKENPDKKIFEASKPEIEFLNSAFSKTYKNEDFARFPLRMHYIDIEVAVENEFPSPVEAEYPINMITVYDTDDRIFHTWSLGQCKATRDDAEIRIFESEFDLLEDYLKWHEKNYPDIIVTYNGDYFDIPYICKRMSRILGKEAIKRLSPIGSIYSRTDEETGDVSWFIECITSWDYYKLYKYKYKKKSNGAYKLGNVGEYVCKIGKIEFEGSLAHLYKKDFQTFYEYNVRDVELLVKIEAKVRILDVSRRICNMGLSPYSTIFVSIPYIINCLGLYTMETRNRVFKTYADEHSGNRYTGAYVFPPKTGFYHNGVAVIDLNSLYPNTMISCNMSPETKVGTYEIVVKTDGTKEYVVKLRTGSVKRMNQKQFLHLLETKCINTENRTLFLKHEIKEGVVTKFLKQMYSDRKKYQKLEDKAKRAIEKTKAESNYSKEAVAQLEFEKDQNHFIQQTWKLFLNSIYGMFGTPYSSLHDEDIAQSITLNGQFVIKSIPEFINNHMRDMYGSSRDVVLFGDTDSTGFDYEDATFKYCKDNHADINNLSRNDIKAICTDLDKFVEDDINGYCAKIVNERYHTSQGGCIRFAREKFCMEAMFFSKKHYILHIVDKEGHKVDEFDYKGIEIAKNELSKEVKGFLKPIYEKTCRERWTQDRFNTELEKVWEEYSNLPIEKVCKNTGWGTDKKVTGFFELEKGADAHVKAATYYNQLIEKMGIRGKYTELRVGNDVQWSYVLPDNPYGIEMIGYNDIYPEEFKDIFQVNYVLKFEKDIIKPLTPLCEIMNWIPFNPNNQSAENIFDL